MAAGVCNRNAEGPQSIAGELRVLALTRVLLVGNGSVTTESLIADAGTYDPKDEIFFLRDSSSL